MGTLNDARNGKTVKTNEDYPVKYVCTSRNPSDYSLDVVCLNCIDWEAALDKAKEAVEKEYCCESVSMYDDKMKVEFMPDDMGSVSGLLEMSVPAFDIAHSHYIDNFLKVPLGQIDHGNHKVFLDCYGELSALWDTDNSIKEAFLTLAEHDYDNIVDFMNTHCDFMKEQALILEKYYGDFNILDDHFMEWCKRYFGGYFRWDFSHKDTTSSLDDIIDDGDVPF